MRRFCYLAACLAVIWAAAMWRYPVLFFLALFMLLFALLQWIRVLLEGRKVTARLPQTDLAVRKDETALVPVVIDNKSKSTVRVELTLRLGYFRDPKNHKQKVCGLAAPGQNTLYLRVRAPYSGRAQLYAKAFRITDPLGLFFLAKPLKKTISCSFLPLRERASYSALASQTDQNGDAGALSSLKASHGQIRQIRPYQEGDLLRAIHWNLSARSETLQVKEYGEEQKELSCLILDTASFYRSGGRKRDAFYTALYNVARAFVDQGGPVDVFWYDDTVHRQRKAACDSEAALDRIIKELYRSDLNNDFKTLEMVRNLSDSLSGKVYVLSSEAVLTLPDGYKIAFDTNLPDKGKKFEQIEKVLHPDRFRSSLPMVMEEAREGTGQDQRGKKEGIIAVLLSLCLFILSFWLMAGQVPSIKVSLAAPILISLLLTGTLWYLHFEKQERKCRFLIGAGILTALALGGLAAAGMAGRTERGSLLTDELMALTQALSGRAGSQVSSIFYVPLMMSFILPWFLYAFILAWQIPIVPIALTYCAALFSAAAGIRFSFPPLCLLAVSWFFLLAARSAGSFRPERNLISKRAGARQMVLSVSACLLALLLTTPLMAPVTKGVYQTENTYNRTVLHLTGKDLDPVYSTRVSRGNRYITNTPQIQVELDQAPTEVVYLKGFVGETYSDGLWEGVDLSTVLNKVRKKISLNQVQSRIMYNELDFRLNRQTIRVKGLDDPVMALKVRQFKGAYTNAYSPYRSEDRSPGKPIFQGETDDEDRSDGYLYLFYEEKDMQVDMDRVSRTMFGRVYVDYVNAYKDVIQDTCTQVPEGAVPRLRELVEKNPKTSLTDIASFVKSTVQKGTSYSLTPGLCPRGQDPAEYFLFTSKEGYCEQYALTTVLLFRLYGVPARYATGYFAPVSAFIPQEDGTYQAVLTDFNAHAWCEIYIDGYGWTPFDTTPGISGLSTQLPAALAKQSAGGPVAMTIPSLEAGYKAPVIEAAQSAGQLPTLYVSHISRSFWVYLLSLFLYALLMSPVFISYRRHQKLDQLGSMPLDALFARLLTLLDQSGLWQGATGNEVDFADRLHEAVPSISPDDGSRLQSLALKAAFGPQKRGREEDPAFVRSREFFLDAYRKTAERASSTCSRRKRWQLKYRKGLL